MTLPEQQWGFRDGLLINIAIAFRGRGGACSQCLSLLQDLLPNPWMQSLCFPHIH